MEATKYKKFFKDDNYVHCSICSNFRNINSFSHRKSKDHQKKLAFKLRKIAFHLSKKKKIQVVIHDEQWKERDRKQFCHFCGESYTEHCIEDEFVVEHLGSLYHHADFHHAESVKAFLKRNFSEENAEKYYIPKSDLNSFLKKLPEAKAKYLKKMDILNDMTVKQIKTCEEERKKIVTETLQEQSCGFQEDSSLCITGSNEIDVKSQHMFILSSILCGIIDLSFHKLNSKEGNPDYKVPPWLEDVPNNPAAENQSSAPVIGPTIDTLMKHELNQKKKVFPKNRIGAHFKHHIQGSSKWLPSFQGTWNKGCRKQSQNQFKRRNQK